MKYLKITLRENATFANFGDSISIIPSDTFTGAFLCTVSLISLELGNKLAKFIREGKLVFSSVFPFLYLPKPEIVPLDENEENFGFSKRWKKILFLKHDISTGKLGFLGDYKLGRKIDLPGVAVDRMVCGSELFFRSEIFYPKGSEFWLFAKIPPEVEDDIVSEIVKLLFLNGIGKEKSRGKGVTSVEVEFGNVDFKGNIAINLGLVFPSEKDKRLLKFYKVTRRAGGYFSFPGISSLRKGKVMVVKEGGVWEEDGKEVVGEILNYRLSNNIKVPFESVPFYPGKSLLALVNIDWEELWKCLSSSS